MKRKKRAGKTTPAPEIVTDAAQRLEKLSEELDAASKEAKQVAEIVQNDLATAIGHHLMDAAAKARKKAD